MSNLTQTEREGLDEVFRHLHMENPPLYRRLLVKLNRFYIFLKKHLVGG
ncbi:hypothetical protein [Hydrogenimonas sp.]